MKGVSERTGMCPINISPVHAQNSLIIDFNYKTEDIHLVTIDAFVKEYNIDRVDLIKMDIEGSEKEALKGARDTICKHNPVLVICTYHLPGDKKSVPELVKEMCGDYEFAEADDG
ncbi:FkbM family methyltransferase, partial [Candidatus Pacearchaeota archaeon]|nr:FkbM family methyltransferase [Candidatus Pacearchaeota archaeon]